MNATNGAILEHTIGHEGLLAIRLRDGDVRFNAIDGDVVRVRDINGHNLDEMFDIEVADGSLSLSAGRGLEIILGPRSMRRGRGRQTPELEVGVPRRASLVVEAASADLRGEGLHGDQRYRTASGDIHLRSVTGRISLEAMSGDIDITATGSAEVTCRSVSGDVALRAATLSLMQLATTSGDLEIAGRLAGPGPFSIETVSGDGLLAPAGDARIEMTSLTGDLTSELEGRQVTEGGRRSLAVGSGGPLVTFRSTSGDLRVVKPVLLETPEPLDSARAGSAHSIDTAQPVDVPPNGAIAAAYDEARLRILRSLERGEIDVAEAGRRLEMLDASDVDAAARSGHAATEPSAPPAAPAPPAGLEANG